MSIINTDTEISKTTQLPTQIRQATPDDYKKLGEVMFDAVRHGDSRYNEQQREAWVPAPRRGSDWVKRLDAQSIYLAESVNQIVGFMSLCPDGYVDFAYIRPTAQGSGVFRRLYQNIEERAVREKYQRLWVHASLMARAPFEAMGFRVLKQETVVIATQQFDRYEMEKQLTTDR